MHKVYLMRNLLDREVSERLKRSLCRSHKPLVVPRLQELDQEQQRDQWTPFVLGWKSPFAPAAGVMISQRPLKFRSRSLLKAG